jgi:anti-sigma factor RsiW
MILDAMEGSLPAEQKAEWEQHRTTCAACAEEWRTLMATSALLDEWRAPEPSAYFDVRLQANLRAEQARPERSWRTLFGWRPSRAFAAATLALLLVAGVGLYKIGNPAPVEQPAVTQEGTAVSDLQSLDKNADIYAAMDNLATPDQDQTSQE